MSVREYAVLYLKAGSSGPAVIGGGNAVLSTAPHAIDGAEHTAASDIAALNATTTAHGLLAKLSGDASDYLNGVGGWTKPGTYYNVKTYGAVGDGTTNDTTAVQAAITAAGTNGGVVYFPPGAYLCGALSVGPKVSLLGAGRRATTIKANANSINLVQITGVATGGGSITEVDTGQWIADIAFNNNSHTGNEAVAYLGVAYFAMLRCSVTGFAIGVEHYGSLQSDIHDVKFVDNATALKYDAQNIVYYGGTVPPNRVSVSWCAFYGNTSHAIDYSGGAQLFVDQSEFGMNGTAGDATTSAVYFHAGAYNNATASGLYFRGGWMEGNKGFAGIYINTSTGAYQHAIEDTYFPTNEATYAVAVDGSSGAQYLVTDKLLIATAATTRGIYRTGSGAYLDLHNSTGVLAGSGGVVRQDPLLDQTNVTDLSQMLALRLPNLTTTAMNAIAAPTAGMTIWNTTASAVYRYDGAAWAAVGSSLTPASTVTGPDAFGASAVVGTSVNYAREDHDHGLPAAPAASDHEHVMDCLFNGDGATVAWELPAAPFDAYSVAAYVAGTLTEVTLSGAMLTTATFGSAPGVGTNNIRFDIVAAVA